MPQRRAVLFLLIGAIALLGAHLLDGWAVTALAYPRAGERDWGRFLRIIGYAPAWGALALALWLDGRRPDAARQVVIAVLVGGIAAEVLKLLIRRERPGDGIEYIFRAYADRPFSSSNFGLPSSHAAVAFAGAAAVAQRFPRTAPVLFGLAAGCGLTRIMAGAHYLSDVVAAALVGGGIGFVEWARRPGATGEPGRPFRLRLFFGRATPVDSAPVEPRLRD